MKHTLQIRVSKKPVNSGAVSVRSVSVRERFMRFLLGDKVRLTVIVPGSSVEELSIREVAEGGLAHEYCMTTGTYTQMLKEQSPTLMARDYKDPPVVNETEPEYIVRRLTPTECARLQGFPDWWCTGLETDEPSEEEIEFWTEVFEIHRSVMGKSSRPKSRNQIIKWLKNPHSDSAEYKMWGNGVALPNVYFVLSGIVYYSQFPDFLL